MLTTKRFATAALAALALLVAGVAAAAQAPADDQPETGLSASWEGKRWTKDGDHVEGRFVSFDVDAETGVVTDYARKLADGGTRVMFTSVAPQAYNASAAKARAAGPALLVKDGDLLRGIVFDARNAAFRLGSPAGNVVTFTVADGIAVEHHAGEPGWSPEGVLLRDGNQTARLVLRGDANATVDGQTVIVTLGPGGHVAFKVDGHKVEELKERILLHKLHRRLADDGDGPRGEGPRGGSPRASPHRAGGPRA